MTVSIAKTTRKYHGRKAETYEAIRTKQERWHLENEVVSRMMAGVSTGPVLDVPVGTGRFLELYEKLAVSVIGIDASDTMLKIAEKKIRASAKLRRRASAIELKVGDAAKLDLRNREAQASVCVRFLDLIDEHAMREVVCELCRVTRRRIVLTIRLGPRYVPKSNTAVHDEKKFRRLVESLGWHVAETVPFREQGWNIIRLERKS